jgi:hypothetical protein
VYVAAFILDEGESLVVTEVSRSLGGIRSTAGVATSPLRGIGSTVVSDA